MLIRGNTLHSQLAVLYPDHHYDNIQFWVQTDANAEQPKHLSLGQYYFRPDWQCACTAIFARGDNVDANGIQNPFQFENFTVAGM